MNVWDEAVANRADNPVEREPDGAAILTSRYSAIKGQGYPFLPGTRITTCDSCGELVVAGPSTLKLRVGLVFCSLCKPEGAILGITKEALNEVDNLMRMGRES